jgi:hypothetical protein
MTTISTISNIERQAEKYSAARNTLRDRVSELQDELRIVKHAHRRAIETAASAAAREQNELYHLVESNPAAFERPRSHIFHGIRVGYRKAPGEISWDDDETLIRRIRRHMPDQFDVLVKTTYKPQRTPLKQLHAADLARLGCTIQTTDDQIVVAPIDAEIDKLVDAILSEFRVTNP